MSIRQKIIDLLKKAVPDLPVQAGKIEIELVVPDDEKFGHYSTNIAFKLAKIRNESPFAVAQKLVSQIKRHVLANLIKKIEAVQPGFVNFELAPAVIQKIFAEILKNRTKFLKPKAESSQTVVIDYSHPNIAKPMSIAHLRSTIIGQALYNIFKFAGWKTISDNHLGDWGKQFGVLIAAFKEKGGGNFKNITINDLMNLYIDYTARMSENPTLEEKAREETKKLQAGNKKNVKIWKKFYQISLAEFKKIYRILNVKFDYYLGESFYKPMLPEVVKEALKKGVAKKSEGAMMIDTGRKTPFIIQKSDGSYLYSTTDIAAVKYRIKKFKADLILYVVDNGQSLHFEHLFDSVKLLKYVENKELVHVKFGLILSEDFKKLSTRAGRYVSLEKLINEAITKAKRVIAKKRPALNEKEKEEIAKIVGIGALKYNDLSQNRLSDISFNWTKMLNLEGNSAPYLQYTYVRLRSILRKKKNQRFNPADLRERIELDLIFQLSEFPEIIRRITKTYYPNLLADYLYKLARRANVFYETLPVLKAEEKIRNSRLALIGVVAVTLKTGLNLLGIEILERM
jgi:arginyl-tRNA synthetase